MHDSLLSVGRSHFIKWIQYAQSPQFKSKYAHILEKLESQVNDKYRGYQNVEEVKDLPPVIEKNEINQDPTQNIDELLNMHEDDDFDFTSHNLNVTCPENR